MSDAPTAMRPQVYLDERPAGYFEAFHSWARTHGPVPALHSTGLLLTALAALATGAATLLPGR